MVLSWILKLENHHYTLLFQKKITLSLKKGPAVRKSFLCGGVGHLQPHFLAFMLWWGFGHHCSLLVRCLIILQPDTMFIFSRLNQDSLCCSPTWHGHPFSLLISTAISMQKKVSQPSVQITLIIVIYGAFTMKQQLC